MAKVIILYSGGADSVYLICLARMMKHEIKLIMFDYGQKHAGEIEAGKALLKGTTFKMHPPLEAVVINLRTLFLHSIFSNLLVGGNKAAYPGVHPMHVPARNGIFCMIALGIAEANGHDEVWIGCDYDDRINNFPDCYQEWIARMDAIARTQHSRPLRVRAPLLGFTKSDIKALLQYEDIDVEKVYSGYAHEEWDTPQSDIPLPKIRTGPPDASVDPLPVHGQAPARL